MSVSRSLRRERHLLAGICTYSGCTDNAVDGSSFCSTHDAMERAWKSGSERRRRQKRADAGLCRDGCGRKVRKRRRPDGTIQQTRCLDCKKKRRRGVEYKRHGVECEIVLDLATAIMLGLSQVAQMHARGLADLVPAPCGHAICAVPVGDSAFCVFVSIANAHTQKQSDGHAPAERGNKLQGVEYVQTIERIAQLMDVSTRSVEIWVASALKKLRLVPEAAGLLRSLPDA